MGSQDAWEIQLGGEWQPLGPAESSLLAGLAAEASPAGAAASSPAGRGDLELRGATYRFDVVALTQTNVATGKVRKIRHRPAENSGAAASAPASSSTSVPPVVSSASAPPVPAEPEPQLASAPAAAAAPPRVSGGLDPDCEEVPNFDEGASPSSPSRAAAPAAAAASSAPTAAVLPRAASTRALRRGDTAVRTDVPERRAVEVWLAGEWKRLGERESAEIARRQANGETIFELEARAERYKIDLGQMTQTNLSSGRTRTIRVVDSEALSDLLRFGFDGFREAFNKTSATFAAASGASMKAVDRQALLRSWTSIEDRRSMLAQATANAILTDMDLDKRAKASMTEWIHYWALERDSPSYHAGREVNEKLVGAIKRDDQVLGRMQMHFETAVGEDGGGRDRGLSTEGLLRACRRLATSPKDVEEKRWAKEVLAKQEQGGDGVEEDAELSYYDFLNVMLGRKKFKVSLWMYDISKGAAKNWSWVFLGHHFEGIWHTGVVIEWPEKTVELWFGGSIFTSTPGTTPFGEPMTKRSLGYTYKLGDETLDYIRRHLASEFTRDNYDVLTHNCNHFSEALCQFLINDHIPEDVLYQPDMVMSTVTARLLRPALNRWLGGFDASKDSRATDGGDEARRIWEAAVPGALVKFSREAGGRPIVGEVRRRGDEECRLCSLDIDGTLADRIVPRSLVIEVLSPPPPGVKREPSGEALPSELFGASRRTATLPGCSLFGC